MSNTWYRAETLSDSLSVGDTISSDADGSNPVLATQANVDAVARKQRIMQTALYYGDTGEQQMLDDAEVSHYLAEASNDPLLAAALCCEALYARFSAEYSFSADGSNFQRIERAEAFATLGRTLRHRAALDAASANGGVL